MPLIVVYNLSKPDFKAERIELIEKAITDAVLSIPELELTPANIFFTFPQDPTVTSYDVPVIIIVELLFDKPSRTTGVRQLLARRIAQAFRTAVWDYRKGQIGKIEVAVKRFDPTRDGFYSK